MKWFAAIRFAPLLLVFASCQPPSQSQLKQLPVPLEDEFEGQILSMDVQAGSTRDPNVCLVKKSGQLVCHASGQPNPNYPALRTIGKLADVGGPCAVDAHGSFGCTLTSTDAQRKLPLASEVILRFNFSAENELCAIVKSSGGDYAKCYDASGQNIVMRAATATVENGDGTSSRRADHVVSIAQTHEKTSSERIVCGLRKYGNVECYNYTQKAAMPAPTVKPVRSLAINSTQRCMADYAGALTCEQVKGGSVSLPTRLKKTNVVELSGADQYMCARYQNGDFACWNGQEITDRARFRIFQKAVKVQANKTGICSVFADQKTVCMDPTSGATVTYEELKANAIVASNDQTCSTSTRGQVNCWGNAAAYAVPANLPFPTGQEVAVGANHLCYADDGRLRCLDRSNRAMTIPPAVANSYVTQVVASNNHTCALANKKVSCWGTSALGATNVPSDLPEIASITTGSGLSCALDFNNGLRCWGMAMLTSELRKVPAFVKEVTIGDNHFCVLDRQGQPSCFGSGGDGKLIPAPSPNGFHHITAGANHTCAIDSLTAAPYCWGSDSEGQSLVPSDLLRVKKFAMGDAHSCAIDSNNRVVCWGKYETQDIEGRLEGGTRLKYLDSLFRLPELKKPMTQLPAEPMVAFKGLSLSQAPKVETYAIWVDYETSCKTNIQWFVNGNLSPDLIVDRNNGPITNPNDLRRKAMFFASETPLTEFGQHLSGALTGPAFIQARVKENGTLSRNLPANCSLTLNSVIIVPSTITTTTWDGVATGDKGLDKSLRESLGMLVQYKVIEENTIVNTLDAAIALHETLRENYLRQVRDAYRELLKSDPSMADLLAPLNSLSTNEEIRPYVLASQSLQLLVQEGLTRNYTAWQPVSDENVPDWYWSLNQPFIEETTEQNLISHEMALRQSMGLLQAPLSAETDGRVRMLAKRAARGPLEADMRVARRFLKETGVIKSLLEEGYDDALNTLREKLEEAPEFVDSQAQMNAF